MKNALITIFNPSVWIMGSRFNRKCDEWCIEALKNPIFTNIGEYRCEFNGKKIWIGNQGYGFEFEESGIRPSRSTVLNIHKALDDVRWAE